MITVDQHRADVLELAVSLDVEQHPLAECVGRTLREDVVAASPLPGFDNAAMDGYAVRAADIAAAPVSLPVAADIAAGATAIGPLPAGAAARIMTGAPVPTGADCVVQVELTDGGAKTVRIDQAVPAGTAIRLAGGDVKAGEMLLTNGQFLTPGRIGLAAAAGRSALAVARRPVVTVISTGAELRTPGTELGTGQIFDSNGPLLSALATVAGAQVERHSCHSDDEREFRTLIMTAAETSDLIITTGGVSAGAYEVVKQVLGAEPGFVFRQVAMQPGKPQGFGRIGIAAVLNLPGNPVSAAVSFTMFGVPLLNAMAGRRADELGPATRKLPLGQAVKRKPVRQFLRGRLDLGSPQVIPSSKAGSHMIAGLADADCLIIVPEGEGSLDAGTVVDVVALRG